MISARSGRRGDPVHWVLARHRAERRPLRSAAFDIRIPVDLSGDERRGSMTRALLIGFPLSAALWAPILWAVCRLF